MKLLELDARHRPFAALAVSDAVDGEEMELRIRSEPSARRAKVAPVVHSEPPGRDLGFLPTSSVPERSVEAVDELHELVWSAEADFAEPLLACAEDLNSHSAPVDADLPRTQP